MNTTQGHLAIADIFENILILKDGGGALVLQVSAVNFGLLSSREQIAIISSFAQMLNSLSFCIQIVIHSERLNISSYLQLLDNAKKAQTNPLLSQMISEYKQFIQTTIKENDVLDKKFYLVIPLSSLELGLTPSKENLQQKIKTVLLPRRDQVIRQLSRVSLRATQLTRQKLIELFYDIYNGEFLETPVVEPVNPEQLTVRLNSPQQNIEKQPVVAAPPPPQAAQAEPMITQNTRTHPFVVEELEG
ncbi:hypothetical protein HY383_01870 [Candidatus Daviesbacteria bacterium]|nr:hypothetical protein [Candidatus Daviesbacteria bacterium]